MAGDAVVVCEFKIGATSFGISDQRQVHDYALDLQDFHTTSRGKRIVPILVSTDAKQGASEELVDSVDPVAPVHFANASTLQNLLSQIFTSLSGDSSAWPDPDDWCNGEYLPTPTIIEAARHLYANQQVTEITRSHAGVENLTSTTQAVFEAIDETRRRGGKTVCFITGVPGAGKTLAGLNIIHHPKLHDEGIGVFLSGNGPLVKVLREAIAREKVAREGVTRIEARREVETSIQNVHHFLAEYWETSGEPPEIVYVFDEAQRAWDAAQSKRKFSRAISEPELMLRILDRRKGPAVLVALVGGGQEINSGEAGIQEWGKALQSGFEHWHVWVTPQLNVGHHSAGDKPLFSEPPVNIQVNEEDRLHLSVSIRAYRAERLSEYVAALLSGNGNAAREIAQHGLEDYPLVMTRSLDHAKKWLKSRQLGTRRCGLIASSGARRLKASGLDVQKQIEVEHWFLNSPEDVRSSYYLEDVATEFGIQGLELDWTCLCWGADFRHAGSTWTYHAFKGTKWQHVRKEVTQNYILNKYRVLLTRAREGLIVWVPPGSSADPTRVPSMYDGAARYLLHCGFSME